MLFDKPLPFAQALQSRAVRTVLPTTASSAAMSALPAEIRERAMWSARVTNVNLLDMLNDIISNNLQPEAAEPGGFIDKGQARLMVRELLERTSYRPEEGEADTIKDLRSDRRINLQIDMGVDMARNYGRWIQGEDETVIDFWPCSELIRFEPRDDKRPWPAIWTAAGGKTVDGGRMIARKDDLVWYKISDFDLPYAPFKWGSGMNRIDIGRFEAEELGVIERDEQVEPQTRGFNEDLAMSGPERDSTLLTALLEMEPRAELVDGALVLRDEEEDGA